MAKPKTADPATLTARKGLIGLFACEKPWTVNRPPGTEAGALADNYVSERVRVPSNLRPGLAREGLAYNPDISYQQSHTIS